MNKIDKKVLGTIEELLDRPFTEDFLLFLNLMKEKLKNESQKDGVVQLLDFFPSLNLLMIYMEATLYERGYILNKFLKHNFMIIDSAPYSLIRDGMYKRQLEEVGIMNTKDFVEALKVYFQNPEMLKENSFERYQVINLLLQREEKVRLELVKNYKVIQNFTNSLNKDENSYCLVCNAIKKLGVPDELIEGYVEFHKNQKKDKNERKAFVVSQKTEVENKTITYSKKELKRKLANYYDESEEKEFDYIHFDEVLFLLKHLNFADDVKVRILNYFLQNAISNYSYYRYVMDKTSFVKKDQDILEELNDIFTSMIICSDEDYEFYKTYALELIKKIESHVYESFDFEMQLMRKL